MIKHLLTAHMFPYPQFIINDEQQKYGHALAEHTVCFNEVYILCKRERGQRTSEWRNKTSKSWYKKVSNYMGRDIHATVQICM